MEERRSAEMSESEVLLGVGVQPETTYDSGALTNFLRTSRTELDGLLNRNREIQQESWRVLNSSLEGLLSKLYQELEAASAAFVNETRRRAQYEVSAVLELLDVEASARLSARVDESLAKARAASEEIEVTARERTEQNGQKMLMKLVNSAVKELQGKTAAMLQSFQGELQANLEESKKTVGQISEQLRETTEKVANLSNRADKAQEVVDARLTAAAKTVIDETERQIAALSQTALNTLQQQAATAHRRTSELVARDLRKRLDQVANALQQFDSSAAATAELGESSE